jgi:hypothetical protein
MVNAGRDLATRKQKVRISGGQGGVMTGGGESGGLIEKQQRHEIETVSRVPGRWRGADEGEMRQLIKKVIFHSITLPIRTLLAWPGSKNVGHALSWIYFWSRAIRDLHAIR